jgi:hypothetical protein
MVNHHDFVLVCRQTEIICQQLDSILTSESFNVKHDN